MSNSKTICKHRSDSTDNTCSHAIDHDGFCIINDTYDVYKNGHFVKAFRSYDSAEYYCREYESLSTDNYEIKY